MAGLRFFLIICIIVSSLGAPSALFAEMPERGFFSLRGGFSENEIGSTKESFHQYEGALTLMLPWQHQFSSGFWIKTGLDFTAGILSGDGEDAFVGTIGPRISFRTPEETFSLDIGSGPTYISRDSFGRADFGGPLQFISYAGLYVHFLERYRLGYRFQHMSNASIYSENDGLNMHIFEGGFLF